MNTTVEETDTQTQTDPDAGRGFGDIMQERLAQKSAPKPEEAPAPPAKEAIKKPAEPVKKPTDADKSPPPATTPIADVLDAALSQAPPAPEKAPASPVDEFENVTDGVKSEDVKKRMVGMREKIKTLWGENQTLARTRAELESKVKPPLETEEVKTLLKAKDEEIAKANEALLALNIDSHPAFQAEFAQPRQQKVRSAAQKLQAYGGNGQALIDALYMPEGIRRDEAIQQMLENVPDYAKGKITGIIGEIEALDERAQERRANAPKTWEELNAKDIEARRKKAEEYRGQVQNVYENVTRELSALPFFRELSDDIQGASEWNKDRNGAFERGLNHILGSDNTVDRSILIAIKGERFDAVQNMLLKERELRKAAEKKLTEYEGVQPKVGGGSAPAAKEDDDEKNMGFGDIMARRAARRASGDAD